MALKGVIFDYSNTLVKKATGKAAFGVVAAIKELRSLDLRIIIVENDGPVSKVEKSLRDQGIEFDGIVTRYEVGTNKGSPDWIDYICLHNHLQPNELIYVGDSEYDMITASHSRIIYFHAEWAAPRGFYGIAAPHPAHITAVVKHIFLKENNWWWNLNRLDEDGRSVRQLALIDGYGAGDDIVKANLIAAFKNGNANVKVGKVSVQDFTLLHILAGLYSEGLVADKNIWWTTYPGRRPLSISPMRQFLDISAKLFREKYKDDLFIRAIENPHSRDARNKAHSVKDIGNSFRSQLTSLHLNPDYRDDLFGRRILVFDDFITYGPSSEAARNLLLAAGAADVIMVAIGKNTDRLVTFTHTPAKSLFQNSKAAKRLSNKRDIAK